MRRLVTPRLLILAFLLLAAEFSLAPLFYILKADIGLLHLLVLDYAFSWNSERVPFFSLLIGLARDFAGGHLFGIETVSFTLTGLLLYLGIQKLDREHFLIRLGMTFIFVLLTEFLKTAIGRSVEVSGGLSGAMLGQVLLTAVYTTVCAPAFFWLTNRWFKRTQLFRQYELFSRN